MTCSVKFFEPTRIGRSLPAAARSEHGQPRDDRREDEESPHRRGPSRVSSAPSRASKARASTAAGIAPARISRWSTVATPPIDQHAEAAGADGRGDGRQADADDDGDANAREDDRERERQLDQAAAAGPPSSRVPSAASTHGGVHGCGCRRTCCAGSAAASRPRAPRSPCARRCRRGAGAGSGTRRARGSGSSARRWRRRGPGARAAAAASGRLPGERRSRPRDGGDRDEDRRARRSGRGSRRAAPRDTRRARSRPELRHELAHERVGRRARQLLARARPDGAARPASTATRSARRKASPRSCVTRSTAASQPRLPGEEFLLHRPARDRVERAEGLVHQDERRIGRERAGDADALPLSARELAPDGGPRTRRGQSPTVSRSSSARARRSDSAPAEQAGHRLDVLAHRPVRERGRPPG